MQQDREQLDGTMFGSWDMIPLNYVERAESDGFISAYVYGSGGGDTRFTLEMAPSEEALKAKRNGCVRKEIVRSRAGGFESETIPVREGSFYQVRRCNGEVAHITAYWLPIVR